MNRRAHRLPLLLLGFAGSVLLVADVACSHGPVPPPKDPAAGEYYTEDELRQLPRSEMDRYCAYMETTLQALKSQRLLLESRLDSLKTQIDTLRTKEVQLGGRTREVSSRLRELRLREKATNTYVVTSGDNLRKIARTEYGDGTLWREIYEANKAVIGAEDAELKPGTRLTIPRKPSAGQ